MKNIYKNRLLLLASFLESLPEEKFYYNSWVSYRWNGEAEIGCGTTACALGWATAIPQLADAGLVLRKNIDHPLRQGTVCLRQEKSEFATNYSARDASKEVFDLSEEEYMTLFIPSGSPITPRIGSFDLSVPAGGASAKDVALHIRKFVALKYPGE